MNWASPESVAGATCKLRSCCRYLSGLRAGKVKRLVSNIVPNVLLLSRSLVAPYLFVEHHYQLPSSRIQLKCVVILRQYLNPSCSRIPRFRPCPRTNIHISCARRSLLFICLRQTILPLHQYYSTWNLQIFRRPKVIQLTLYRVATNFLLSETPIKVAQLLLLKFW